MRFSLVRLFLAGSAMLSLGIAASAQISTSLTGSIVDAKGALVPHATVVLHTRNNSISRRTTTDDSGHFALTVPAGQYILDADAPGFATTERSNVVVTADQSNDVTVTLQLANLSQQVDVEADATNSLAAQNAPLDARLDERSARTEFSYKYIQNYLPPTADFGEAVEMAPGTFTTNSNGVGLGQSNTYFRGFPDGDYDIDFDGIPFYDTNTPTHHSWAFFPAQFLGGVDFDRSPGTASTIGPTPFGGSIHLLSRPLFSYQNIRGGFSYGSFNTKLFDVSYDSGSFGPGSKFNLDVDFHHLSSDGYQTYNFQTRNAGQIKVGYKVNDKTTITGFSGVIWLDASDPKFNATRCQMYGPGPGYTCTGTNANYAGAGLNFLLVNNSDPLNYFDYQYNFIHVPTDFEYVGVRSEVGKHFTLEVHPYTYNYDNSQHYANSTPITDDDTLAGKTYAPLGLKIAPCNIPVTKKGITAIPCGVDKYNSYRKYGETSELSQVSHYGILRTGLWYEWAYSSRHQFPSDPLNHWADQALSNFNEKYWTNSYQPFAEYQWYITPRLSLTPGIKWAYYTISTKQYADNGKTIGGLGTNNPNTFITNGGSYLATLPSGDVNYRIRSNWSAYAQIATGSIVPPSGVFDYKQSATGTPVAQLPKQQRNTTYQFGTVVKLRRLTFDADFYHIRFQNSYSSTLDSSGEPVFYLEPSSVTKGFEAESNIYLGGGFNVYLNGSVGRATYVGSLAVSCNSGATGCTSSTPQLSVKAPSGLWIQNTPSDTEVESLTYQKHSVDLGIFNKRVGTMYQDNGQYHNQDTIDPFTTTNLYLNYTIGHGSRFAHFSDTKLRLSFNNLFNSHNITGDNINGSAATENLSANSTTYTDPFTTNGPTPVDPADAISILPGRSVTLSLTFGFTPHLR